MTGKAKKWLAGAAALIPALIFLNQKANWIKPVNTYRIDYVIDGDTFVTREKLTIRFDTFNAPELTQCGGKEAKDALEKLLSGKTVTLNIQARDPSGRQVASVWAGKTWIDEKMIKDGWVAYASSTVDKEHILKNIDLENEKNKIGIYSEKCTQFTNPVKPKCNIKGNIVNEWTTRGDKIYHFPGCAQYPTVRVEKWRGEEWFCTEKEAAAAGYRKSGMCPN